MEACIKICLKCKGSYYSCFVTIIHQFETDFIHVEFLDNGMIEAISTRDISYIGEKGYQKLPVYNIESIRPVLIQVGNAIACTQYIVNKESLKQMEDDEYFRSN